MVLALYYLGWLLVLANWNNSPWIDMSLHSEILYPDSPLLFLNAAWRGNNYQVYSRWFDPRGAQTH
jgi:hypothetical protein